MGYSYTQWSRAKVGDTFFRPDLAQLTLVDWDVPWAVVKAYLTERCPSAEIGGHPNQTARRAIETNLWRDEWMDALAVVIAQTASRVTMIYLKDWKFMLLTGVKYTARNPD